jgi:uncharacterized integral membrane protein (TIGR00698 family)
MMNLFITQSKPAKPAGTDKADACFEEAGNLMGELQRHQVAQWGVCAAVVCGLLAWGTPPLALACGILIAFTVGSPIPKAGYKFAKWLLQACVVLLGFGMDLNTVLQAGLHGAVFAAMTIAITLTLGYWVGRWLRIGRNTSMLISAGTAICGGSAIAAVSSVLVVTEAEIGVAMGTVFLLNAVSLYLFPALGHILHLTQQQFGVWSGVAIHDISSVVGASLSYGPQSLEVATAVKLSRSLWIVPLTLGIGMAYRARAKRNASHDKNQDKSRAEERTKLKTTIPWFIGLFLLASIMRSSIPAIATWTPEISRLAKAGLTVVLLLIGTGISPHALRTVGWKTGIQGVILWVVISAISLFAIVRYGVGY